MRPVRLAPLLVLIATLGFSFDAAGREVDDAAATVARMTARYRRARSFRARFVQVFVARTSQVRKRWSGWVAGKRSGQLSFVYDHPRGRRVVSDGKRVESYDPTTKRLYRVALRRSHLGAVLAFLRSARALRERYHFRLIPAARAAREGAVVLEALPRKRGVRFDRVLFYLNRRSGAVRRVMIVDAAGNINRFDLSAVKLDGKLPARTFRLRTPAGAKLVEP